MRSERGESVALTCLASFRRSLPNGCLAHGRVLIMRHVDSERECHFIPCDTKSVPSSHHSTESTHHRTSPATAPRSHRPNSSISFSYRTSRIGRGRFEVCIPDDNTSTMQRRGRPNRQPCHSGAMVTSQLLASNRSENGMLRMRWFGSLCDASLVTILCFGWLAHSQTPCFIFYVSCPVSCSCLCP